MRLVRWCMVMAALGLLPSPAPAFAEDGEAVAVVQRAVIRSDGETVPLDVGRPVKQGDIIATGSTGQAEVIFTDDTRIVVGPNSQLNIDRAIFRSDNSARRLTISAVRGSFRFLSGNSRSRAYRLRTPIATMGVRGTSFDVVLNGDEATDLAVFTGAVRFCARGQRCARVPGGCSTVSLDRRGRFSQPGTVGERAEKLSRFPFVFDQSRLGSAFRAATESCGGANPSVAVLDLPVAQIDLPEETDRALERDDTRSNPAD